MLARTLLSSIREPRRFEQYLAQQDLQLAAVLIPHFKLSWQKDPELREKLKRDLIAEASFVTLDDTDLQVSVPPSLYVLSVHGL